MRLFYFLLLFSSSAIALPPSCDETDIVPGANLNTCTSLTVNADIDLTGSGGGVISITGITGNVTINADIILDGDNGSTLTADNPGGIGGPGAVTDGGGMIGNTAQAAGFDPEDGAAGVVDPLCSSGGGGGGGAGSAGVNGFACPLGSSTSLGGSQFTFPFPLTGGHGGGAGGEKTVAAAFDLGSGGGGGGAIYIDAIGTITIADGVRISSRGGRGGNSVNIGGAGGGGAGGNIRFVSATAITNRGVIDVRGGDGGSVRSSSPQGGIGGTGGSGVFRTEIGANPPIDLTGLQDFSSGIPTSSSSNLKSNISCGTIAKKNDNSMMFQMMMAFILVLGLGSFFSKRHSREWR